MKIIEKCGPKARWIITGVSEQEKKTKRKTIRVPEFGAPNLYDNGGFASIQPSVQSQHARVPPETALNHRRCIGFFSLYQSYIAKFFCDTHSASIAGMTRESFLLAKYIENSTNISITGIVRDDLSIEHLFHLPRA